MRAASLAQTEQGAVAAETEIAGLACLLDPSGAIFVPGEGLLVVADLHLEKGSAFAKRGSLLPPYDTRATISALSEAVHRYDPARVIALGDSFHDRKGPDRLGEQEREALAGIVSRCDWTWITGNHDPELPPGIGGTTEAEVAVGPLVLRHHPQPGGRRELAGHLHPVAKVVLYGRSVRARAFLTDGERCVLPAFGAYAGGLNACAAVFEPLFAGGFTAHVIGRNRLFALARSILCKD